MGRAGFVNGGDGSFEVCAAVLFLGIPGFLLIAGFILKENVLFDSNVICLDVFFFLFFIAHKWFLSIHFAPRRHHG